MTDDQQARRRRLDNPEEHGNRSGCLMLGAVLGVIVGIMFALYGLPPILRAIYGEETVKAGMTYRGDGRVISVTSIERVSDRFLIELQVTTNKSWDIDSDAFQLEISTQEDWIPALPADDRPETSFDFTLGEERTLLLRFKAPSRVDARPEALHLAIPRVNFELEPEE